jgi:hypothetical protein
LKRKSVLGTGNKGVGKSFTSRLKWFMKNIFFD